jgi:hypothetical protein
MPHCWLGVAFHRRLRFGTSMPGAGAVRLVKTCATLLPPMHLGCCLRPLHQHVAGSRHPGRLARAVGRWISCQSNGAG